MFHTSAGEAYAKARTGMTLNGTCSPLALWLPGQVSPVDPSFSCHCAGTGPTALLHVGLEAATTH